ncbi:efflux RND transporter periplasmic adaptor subunit [Magnetococcus sp. PR-3]|uniref:efflux RND transporter periplasmic adaptor subunit n=1 Tax=Magnetococcus sp. PR-3 TaxID=3120355 RepID=UPI002FCDEE8E
MINPRPFVISSILLFSSVLLGCQEQKQVKELAPRPIAWIKVEGRDFAQVRRISGLMKPAETAKLSFDISGRVSAVKVTLGDSVKAGQELARLDTKSYRLNVEAVKGQLQEAQASLTEAKNHFKRQSNLFKKGWVAQAAFDDAKASLDSALSAVKIAQAQLDLANKTLMDTVLRAPYDGRITARFVEPSQRIVSSAPCFEIEGKQGLEIAVMVPETLIGQLDKTRGFQATFPALPDLKRTARISEIGSRAETANAFPVTLFLEEQHKGLRSGMSTEVDFTFKGRGRTGYTGPVLLVPPSALLAGHKQQVFVFVYNPKSQTVNKRKVQTESVLNNEVYISQGLSSGEIIATAGVAYLSEGQKVTLLGQGPKRFN